MLDRNELARNLQVSHLPCKLLQVDPSTYKLLQVNHSTCKFLQVNRLLQETCKILQVNHSVSTWVVYPNDPFLTDAALVISRECSSLHTFHVPLFPIKLPSLPLGLIIFKLFRTFLQIRCFPYLVVRKPGILDCRFR